MEPARKALKFEPIPHGQVIVIIHNLPVYCDLHKLGDELFADLGDEFVQLYKDGFTSGPYRWEHFPNCPINIRCNALGRIVHA